MAYFSRLIAFFLLTFSASSFALTVESEPLWRVPSYSVEATPEAACAVHDSARGISSTGVASDSPTTRKCMGFWPPDTKVQWYNTAEMVCDTGMGSLDTAKLKCVKTVTVCPAGTVDVDGVCAPPPCPHAGTDLGGAGTVVPVAGSGGGVAFCQNNCVVTGLMGGSKDGIGYVWGPFTASGANCSGEPSASGPAAPPKVDEPPRTCPAGRCPFSLNGIFVCTPCDTTTEGGGSSSSESTSNTPAGASAPESSASSSSSSSSTTKCEGGKCTTEKVVTVVNPDGSTETTNKSETESQGDFCTKNPNTAICKAADEGKWGGACGNFVCDGDAVQCAQAQASWKSACASDVSGMTEQINTGTAAMAAGAASGLGIPGGSDAFDLGSRLSEVPLFGSSGGCPSDVSVNVGGTSYTIMFSSMCPQLQVLGVALMAFAYLVAGFIVFRGDRS